jgi:hypothetical protein
MDTPFFHLEGRFRGIKTLRVGRRAIELRANHNRAVLRYVEEVSGNVAVSCRYCGVSG